MAVRASTGKEVTRVVAAVTSEEVTADPIAPVVVIAMFQENQKKSTKKKSRIKYAKHRPNYLARVVAVKASKPNTVVKNVWEWLNRATTINRITSCR
jgi:hypothetical protein